MLTPERSARRLLELNTSHTGHALAPEMQADDADERVIKRCYSALAPGSSNLDAVLRAHNIKYVLIGGTATNACCESTARDAMMMDYCTIMVDDALSAYTEGEHITALQTWMLFFGDVLSSEEVLQRLRPVAVIQEEASAGAAPQT